MTLSLIFCPIDFSVATASLVAYAATLAAGAKAELRLLHVLPQPALATDSTDLALAAQMAHHRAAAEQLGAQVTTSVLRGEAAPEIVAAARRHAADLIVIGAHGQTGLTRFLMGSTAEAVVRTAPCATLLVNTQSSGEYRKSA
ncbi:universal stress protein [Hymenobacter chitinivorans]|uniref:Nucleotide-binding universal stress UspA family protein n=1 Tax=Hymenobacter chitinivorans DSM 11115 TaxID=1121954 RepID=A0A2M9ASA3_9BACT|nr:universal stress protein [Hymenobacter chitinivorans]PJJ48582.1 nucleotide-binding universal stress UspA family protein [Hymenobacter chitinivorans DSM 11115]